MKKPLDRISQAYYGELGEKLSENTRSRIHWICANATGEDILDVGCSQGITSIILGREGKKVLGIDLLEESVQYAQEKLENEETYTKENVIFEHNNFMTKDFEKDLYDAIIFGEVLEHITEPERFINKAQRLLSPNGRIIVTVPFGINDYFDHKKTYYLIDLFNLQNEDLGLIDIEFFGKWIGVIFKRNENQENKIELNEQLIKHLEVEFYKIERELLSKNRNYVDTNRKLKEQSLELEQVNQIQLDKLEMYEEKIEKFKKELTNYEVKNDKLKSQTFELKKENHRQLDNLDEYQREIEKLNQGILNYQSQLQEEKEAIKEFKKKELNYYSEIENMHNNNFLLTKNIETLTNKVSNISDLVKNQEDINKLKTLLSEEKRINKKLKRDLEISQNKLRKLSKPNNKESKDIKQVENENKNTKLKIAIKEKINTNERLLESYEKEERLLKSYNALRKKYEALSNSKLGSLQLAYWRKRGKWRRREKSTKSEE